MKIYTFVSVSGSYAFNKQESVVFNSIRELKSGTIEEIAMKCVENGLKTKQDPERIVAYYLVSLKKLGLIESSGSASKKIHVTIA